MVTIRHAIAEDSKQILDILERALDVDSITNFYTSFAEINLTVETEAKMIESALIIPTALYLVAEQKGSIVGHCQAVPYPQIRRRHVAKIGMIVRESERGGGIGTMLLQEMISWARKNPEITALHGWVVGGNPAIGFYEREGFKIVGCHPNAVVRVTPGEQDKIGSYNDLLSLWMDCD